MKFFVPSLNRFIAIDLELNKLKFKIESERQRFSTEMDRLKQRLRESLKQNSQLELQIKTLHTGQNRLNVSIVCDRMRLCVIVSNRMCSCVLSGIINILPIV